jgi:hypothetical protein
MEVTRENQAFPEYLAILLLLLLLLLLLATKQNAE